MSNRDSVKTCSKTPRSISVFRYNVMNSSDNGWLLAGYVRTDLGITNTSMGNELRLDSQGWVAGLFHFEQHTMILVGDRCVRAGV